MPDAQPTIDRRKFLASASCATLLTVNAPSRRLAAAHQPTQPAGVVTGHPIAANVGMQVLDSGGNAVDAIVAAALTAGVVAPHQCGIGGYGGHMTIALAGAKKVTAIDYNSMAPAAATHDMFPLDPNGKVPGLVNEFGWLAAGVPGVLAGMQLALDRYGTRSFGETVQPAIEFTTGRFELTPSVAGAIRATAERLKQDPGSARVYFPEGQPPKTGAVFTNPDLGAMLRTLAERDSVDSFYRGDIAGRIADGFAKGGGLVTSDDLAAYRAREVEPIRCDWRGDTIYTAPLTSGGATMVQTLLTLKALDLTSLPHGPANTHAQVEARRIAWQDRLTLFGDPEQADVPLDRLLSEAYARESAERVRHAVKSRKALQLASDAQDHGGTIHLSAADRDGNLVALTLTHGNAFGARVTVPGLGLTLGHGVSRFDPRADHPNSPGPCKRPLHNMCPTVVVRDGHAVAALGGRGGRRIPNAITDVLTHVVGERASLVDAVAARRIHTEGDRAVRMEPEWPADHTAYLKSLGYRIVPGRSAVVDAVGFDSHSGEITSAAR